MTKPLGAAALLLGLAACGGPEANVQNNVANVAVEEGLGAANMVIRGDEHSPIPEAEDDMAANAAGGANAAAPGNGAAPQAPPVPIPAPPPQGR